MSYGYIGTFVDAKNKVKYATADVSFLKSLNQRSYACDLKDVIPTGKANSSDFPEVTTTVRYEYIGFYKEDVLGDLKALKFTPYVKKDWNKNTNAYFIERSVYEEHKEKFQPYEVIVHSPEYAGNDAVILYGKFTEDNNGQWYRREDFEKVEPNIKRAFFEKKKELHELKKLRNTKDWFEMSEDARNNYFEEVNYLESAIEEDYEPEYEAIEYVLNIFDFFENYANVTQNEFEENIYKWSYDDKREIELYIEVA